MPGKMMKAPKASNYIGNPMGYFNDKAMYGREKMMNEGGPIKINSFFRSVELNKAIGGSSKSQHCEGRAIDIDDTYGHKTNAEMYNYIKNNLDFDQLIWEFGTDNNPDWVHVSYVSPDSNRNRCLKAYRDSNNKTKYEVI